MDYANLTPHTINLNDGRSFAPSGTIARVSVSFSDIADDCCEQSFGEVIDLPEPVEGTRFIVSGMVLAACKGRADVVAPATGHPDVIRDENRRIKSVPGFVRA
jgi:hypothetical protein